MQTVLLVKSDTNVSVPSQVPIQLIPFGSRPTISLTPENGTINIGLTPGLYKFVADRGPQIVQSQAEILPSIKDEPSDPTVEKIRAVLPGASKEELREFFKVPGSKGD